jgi:CRP/FNR family transcriptional regulator, cyclic AMP receptor protein
MAAFRVHKDQRVALLRGVSLFSNCSNAELNRIGSLMTMLETPEGSVLVEQGTPGLEFFILVEGTATASRSGLQLAVLEPGSFFGELALLDGGERTATVVATTDMRLLVLTRHEFMSLQSSAPSVAYKMLTELGSRLRKADVMLEPGLSSLRSL